MKRLAWAALLSFAPFLTSHADDDEVILAYTAPETELLQLENGIVVEGSDLSNRDAYTSGFRLSAEFTPWQLPLLDIGAELAYRASEEVPIGSGVNHLLLDTFSVGGALVAGIRLGGFSIYAKSGLAEWRGETTGMQDQDDGGTASVTGFGATMTFHRLVSRLEYERIDAPTLSHLNQFSASVHLPF
ncbi:hypothetical protein R5M92_06305 [Halomonas sp. Bachu 37]|uniref:outer membrane beta-barrel protein n=1 Tax=Halomonas kashgarensis TaxID=3084920 RepID=UPI003216B89C